MKKLTKSEIVAELKKVVSPRNKVGWGKVNENLVFLDGKFCSDELREIAHVMDKCFKGTVEDPEIQEID